MYGFEPTDSVDSYSAMVVMLDGTTADAGDITFDQSSYHFYRNGADITNRISQTEKANNFPQFSREKDNLRAYNEAAKAKTGVTPAPTGSTSVVSNFFNQLATEPFRAPIDALKKSTSGTGVGTIAGVAIGLVILGAVLSRR